MSVPPKPDFTCFLENLSCILAVHHFSHIASKLMFRAFIVLVLCCLPDVVSAQILRTSETFPLVNAPHALRLSVFGGASSTLHLCNFNRIPGYGTTFLLSYMPDLSLQNDLSFRNGFTFGVATGVGIEIPFGETVFLGVRGSLATHGGMLNASQYSFTLDKDGNPYYPSLDHQFSFVLQSLTGEAYINFALLGDVLPNLRLSLGLNGGTPIGDSSFSQTVREELRGSPTSLAKPTPSSISGKMSLTSPMLGIMAGIGYDIPLTTPSDGLGGRWTLTPELAATMYVLPVVSNLRDNGSTWNMLHFRSVVSLKYEFPRALERIDEYEQIDTFKLERTVESLTRLNISDSLKRGLPSRKQDTMWLGNVRRTVILQRRTDTLITSTVVLRQPKLHFSVGTLGVMPDGKEVAVPEVRVEEIIGQKYFPLLSYIFFSEGASELPARYIRLNAEERARFEPSLLKSAADPLYIYHHILNVLGRRMNALPELTLTLTGCNTDVGVEKGNRALSEARALAVKQYLCDVWGVAAERITIQARNLSEKPSLPLTEADKREENRRVEMHLSQPEMFQWVVTNDTVRTATPPSARFITRTEKEECTDCDIRSWRLTITHKRDTVRVFEGDSIPPQLFDWEFSKEARLQGKDLGTFTEPFILHPSLTSNGGTVVHSEDVSLPIKQITVQKKRREHRRDKEFEEFSMMLFEFNASGVSAEQMRTVDFIKTQLKDLSEMRVVGYTDRTGTADYDRKLSLSRAETIANSIIGTAIPSERVTVLGVGKDELLYDNDIPEGRFYCRTVKVTIETPIVR